MSEVFAYGFGAVLGDFELRNNAAGRLFDSFSEKRAKRFIRDWRKESPEMDWDRYLTVRMLTDGPEKMLADMINELEFGGKKVVTGEKGVLYFSLDLPKNEKDISLIPTEKKARDILQHYISICYKNVKRRDIDYYFFEEDD